MKKKTYDRVYWAVIIAIVAGFLFLPDRSIWLKIDGGVSFLVVLTIYLIGIKKGLIGIKKENE